MNVKEMFDSVALSLIAFLESHEGVKNVQLFETKPATQSQVDAWEKTNKITMPSELKSFLLYSNGFLLKWKISLSEEREVQMGYMSIHSIEKMVEVKRKDDDTESLHPFHAAFELSNSTTHCNGRVCFVYKDQSQNPATAEIWYQDLGMNWWFISKTFVEYFRLMILHLGLPNWQMVFTDTGLPSITKQWIRFLSPQRLLIDLSRLCLNKEALIEMPESMNEVFKVRTVSRVTELRNKNKKKKKVSVKKKTKIDLKKLDAMASKNKKKEKSFTSSDKI
ncbi:hypothetical protein C9374_006846 [Naegleria lovaniensis]|uniref:Knr4/Smi1-like domain-containing protein n=1 Tax=Naegleria lovaniensis TaxID=51637 RepID=A0AA88H241_NAELO|nr:uncharacterized protein C9374_006846 [Naegleria lovaniensis]KAG2393315.1 hypothetical protein C9374_006846 [Naegleria lovaniensis]